MSMSTHKVVFRSKVMTALFLGVLGYVPLWGQDLNSAPVKPDSPAKIQSALWELAVPSAGKLTRAEGVEDTVVVILVPHRGQASASIDTSFLTWNDWPTSREDYDLYLDFVNSSGDLEFVAYSIDPQRDLSSHIPVERIEITAEQSGKYEISVRSENDARPRRLKIWSLNHDFEKYSVAENSIGSPADARGAMSVGAVHFDEYDLGRIADYSSRGPTTDGRFKPELVAPSGVSTASYGESEVFYGYTGTSAAAPHVAGAAALIKSANPSYSRDDLWDAL